MTVIVKKKVHTDEPRMRWSHVTVVTMTCTEYQETFFQTYELSEDSDQPPHSRNLIRIFTRCILNSNDTKFLHVDNEDTDQTARVQVFR